MILVWWQFKRVTRQWKTMTCVLNGSNQAHWQAFIHHACKMTYSVTTYSDSSFDVFWMFVFFLRLVYLHHDLDICCQHPNVFVRAIPNFCSFIPSCWLCWRIFFISVVSWTAIYCVGCFLWTKCFSVKLKPKGVSFYSHYLCFTLTENICCLLPSIPM